MTTDSNLARRMWQHLEAIHAYLYYAPEAFAEAEALGYPTDTRWPSYFAFRAAPLGAAGPELVSSAFYSFSPAMVAEHVPAAWAIAAPSDVLAARLRAVDKAIRALPGDLPASAEVAEAASIAREAAEAARHAGRPLSAANADLPWSDDPHLVLWQALTILRENRGDGHIAALLTSDLDACEALVSFAAVGAASTEAFASRGWTEMEWATAGERLTARGWITGEGHITDQGRDGRNRIELLTDQLALRPWSTLGAEKAERLTQVTMPLLVAVLESGRFPSENTLGIGRIPNPTPF